MWEEPCISGTQGSGAVFFPDAVSGVSSVKNFEIAEETAMRKRSQGTPQPEIFLELQEQGAANINLVTAAHYVPAVIESLKKRRRREWICR